MFAELTLLQASILGVLIAFAVTYFVTPALISAFKKRGITGLDVHKVEKPVRAKMGGLGAVIGFTVAVLFVGLFFPSNGRIQAAVLTVIFAALIGEYDDLNCLRQRHKVLLLLLAAAPLTWALQSRSTVYIPFLGILNLGLLYPFLLVPVGISAASNLTNMLAGFNGLEAGLGSMALSAVAISALVVGKDESFLVTLPMVVALCAFLIYNRYPARVFPGDAGTLAIGAALASAVIIGGIEFVGVFVLIPHIIDFFLKFFDSRGKCKPFEQRMIYGDTVVSRDGLLQPPSYLSLTNVFMRAKPMTEGRLVRSLVLCEALFGIVVIILSKILVV